MNYPNKSTFSQLLTSKSSAYLLSWTALIAITYYISGRLGLLLAIPPGFATAVWPPSGIALASVVLSGRRAFAGIWLGSFLLNVSISFDASSDTSILTSIIIASGIALGSTMQAALGGWLVKKFVAAPLQLIQTKDILRFIFLAGPISCCIAASTGVCLLHFNDLISTDDFFYSWWTWWSGDAIGVITISPLLLIWSDRISAMQQRRRLIVSLPAIVCFSLVVFLFFKVSIKEHDRISHEFNIQSQHLSDSLQHKLSTYAEAINSIKQLYLSSDNVTSDEFRKFASTTLNQLDAFTSVSFNIFIEDQHRKSYEQLKQNQGIINFEIHENNSSNEKVRAQDNQNYLVIENIEPSDSNAPTLGRNIKNLPGIEEILAMTAEADSITATKDFYDLRAVVSPSTINLFLPVEKNTSRTETTEIEQKLLGYIAGSFITEKLIKSAINKSELDAIIFEISANTPDGLHQQIYRSSQTDKLQPTEMVSELMIPFADKQLSLRYTASKQFLLNNRSLEAWSVLAGGLLFTSILSAFLLAVTGNSAVLMKINQKLSFAINDQILTNDALKISEKRFHFMADFLPQMIWTADQTGNINYCNQRWFDYTGLNYEESKDWGWEAVIHPEDLQDCIRLWSDAIRTGSSLNLECRIKRASDNVYRWQLSKAHALKDENQNVILWVGSNTDIHDYKLMQLGLIEESEERFKSLANFSPVGIFQTDKNGACLYTNPQWSNITGLSPAEALGTGWASAIYHEDKDLVLQHWTASLKNATDFRLEFRFINSNQQIRYVSTLAAPVKSQTGDIIGYVGTTEDITERKDSEEALRIATEAKSKFLANVSHEIRTPLTAILGFSEELHDSTISAEKRSEAVNIITNNANHLLNLVNDILDFSKIEVDKLDINFDKCDLNYVLTFVQTSLQQSAAQKNLYFDLEINYPVPKSIRTDSMRLIQILINLVSNAIKFTNIGGVKLVVSFDQQSRMLFLKVVDTGLGIKDDQFKFLFKEFTQADASTTKQFGGTGLGLAISKRLANLLGGDITVESEYKNGSSFTVSVTCGDVSPQNLCDQLANKSMQATQLQAPALNGSVLIVEDGIENQKLLRRMLEKANIAVKIAENGSQAVEIAGQESFDLIIMDMQMPVMDGYCATKVLRAQGLTVPIIACSADCSRENTARCLQTGCNDIIFKPFDRSIFFSTLKKYMKLSACNNKFTECEDAEFQKIKIEFINSLPDKLDRINQAIKIKDMSEVKLLAHSLAVAGMLGMKQLSDLALSLEVVAASEQADLVNLKFSEIMLLSEQLII